MLHQINISIHVATGTIALIIGLIVLLKKKGTAGHFRFGRYFLILLSVVVATGFLGSLLFRTNPFLFMLSFLAGYNGYAGFRNVRLKQQRTTAVDAWIAFGVLMAGIAFLASLRSGNSEWSPSVIYSTVGALAFVTVFDLAKFFFFHARLRTWWIYEHIYKLVSAFGAILAAFTGTVLPDFKPFSQVGPSIVTWWIIGIYVLLEARKRRKTRLRRGISDNGDKNKRPEQYSLRS